MIIGGAVLALGSLGLGLRTIFKNRAHAIKIPLGSKKIIYKNVKAIVHYELLDNYKHDYDMEDMVNTIFLNKLNTIIIVHKITRAILLETLNTVFKDYNKPIPAFEELNDDELLDFLPDFWCPDADIIKVGLGKGPVFYSIKPNVDELHYMNPELEIIANKEEEDEDDYSE